MNTSGERLWKLFFYSLDRRNLVSSDAILNVAIKEIAVKKISVVPYGPNGCSLGGVAVSEFRLNVKYSITNIGSVDFLPPAGYNGHAECPNYPAIYKFLVLDVDELNPIPPKYATCVVNDGGSDSCAAAASSIPEMRIRVGQSFGVTQDITAQFVLTSTQISVLKNLDPNQVLNIKLFINPLIAGGNPGSISVTVGSQFSTFNWLSADVFPPLYILSPVQASIPASTAPSNAPSSTAPSAIPSAAPTASPVAASQSCTTSTDCDTGDHCCSGTCKTGACELGESCNGKILFLTLSYGVCTSVLMITVHVNAIKLFIILTSTPLKNFISRMVGFYSGRGLRYQPLLR